jgi:hypothetical protein
MIGSGHSNPEVIPPSPTPTPGRRTSPRAVRSAVARRSLPAEEAPEWRYIRTRSDSGDNGGQAGSREDHVAGDAEYGLLGPLTVRRGGASVQVAPGKQRVVLAPAPSTWPTPAMARCR